MWELGLSATEISRRTGIDRSYISHVIAGRFKSKKVRKAIAQAIDMKMKDLWPGKPTNNEKNNHKNKRKAA